MESHAAMHLNIHRSHLQLRVRVALQSLYAVFLVCLVSAGLYCSGALAFADMPPAIVTAQDSGKTIEVAVGQKIFVQLASNPTTGYQWNVIGSPSPLKFVKSNYASDSQTAGRIGAGGTQTLQFTAESRGKVELKLGYARHWEKDVPPAKIFSVTIIVK